MTAELAARGYRAVDGDTDEFSEWAPAEAFAGAAGTPVEAGRDWVWREHRMEALLSDEGGGGGDVLFVSGCAPNMGRFLPRFDHVVLLSAPAAVIAERLRTRTNNPYGKDPAETARVLGLIDTVEPLLRRAATHEVVTDAPLETVVTAVLRIVRPDGGPEW